MMLGFHSRMEMKGQTDDSEAQMKCHIRPISLDVSLLVKVAKLLWFDLKIIN